MVVHQHLDAVEYEPFYGHAHAELNPAFTVLFVYPFIWLLSASLKTGAEVFNDEIIPNPIQWENYSTLIGTQPILQWTWNSVIVSFLAATTVTVELLVLPEASATVTVSVPGDFGAV